MAMVFSPWIPMAVWSIWGRTGVNVGGTMAMVYLIRSGAGDAVGFMGCQWVRGGRIHGCVWIRERKVRAAREKRLWFGRFSNLTKKGQDPAATGQSVRLEDVKVVRQ